jgi:hypothetical protein
MEVSVMKHRVRLDLSFDSEADAQALMNYAKRASKKAVSIREGEVSEEIAFCDLELCRHDEGLPCTRLERVEVRKLKEPSL